MQGAQCFSCCGTCFDMGRKVLKASWFVVVVVVFKAFFLLVPNRLKEHLRTLPIWDFPE